jgi:hypothetical protein
MGIKVEFNPDLALRNISHYKNGERLLEECIPEKLDAGKTYQFLKEGMRNYWLEGEIPLVETQGGQKLSRPLASVIIQEAIHFLKDGKLYTRGTYEVKAIFDPHDSKIRFENLARII